MYFNIEGYRPETPTIESAISRREGLLLSLIVHLLVVLALATVPRLPFVQEAMEARAERQAELARQAALEAAYDDEEEPPRFVFVAPDVDLESPVPPERGFLSDLDRLAQAPERAPDPANPLPFAPGDAPAPIEAETSAVEPGREAEAARAEGSGPEPEPAEGAGGAEQARASVDEPAVGEDGQWAALTPPQLPSGAEGRAELPGGSLGEALRNLERYVPQEGFANPEGGGGQFGPWIDFDTKGVEFGPWIRRFVAQIRRNWFIPMAAMSLRGHVVVTFNVHKDGAITDLQVVKPSSVQAFNNSSYNALAASNPTQPLPPEYPADQAFFTVTFFYNESPAP